MSTNSTQIGHIPSESLLESNNDNDSNTDRLLSTEIVTISQQSLIQFNATNVIPSQIPLMPNRTQSISSHVSEYENLTRGQLGRRRRRQRQRQRRQQRRREQRQQQEREWQQQHQRWQQRERQQQREQLQQEIRRPRSRR